LGKKGGIKIRILLLAVTALALALATGSAMEPMVLTIDDPSTQEIDL
jgi:hypothetical protein